MSDDSNKSQGNVPGTAPRVNVVAFGHRLRSLRDARGLPGKALAVHVRIPHGTIAAYETGRMIPDCDRVVALAEFFGVSLDYLLFGKATTDQVEAIDAP